MRLRQRLLALVVVAVLFAAGRGPLQEATLSLPVSNDDAVLLLMARHITRGELATTLWNQPYNGALDAYLLAPGLFLMGHHHAYRAYGTVLALLLVLLAGLLARCLGGERAGWAAAGLAALGTPYMALMAATGPPPNFLMPLVTGFPLVVALRHVDPDGPALSAWGGFLAGIVAGLAVWNSSLAIPALAGIAVGLALCGFRPGRALVPLLLGLALGASPLLVARLAGASGSGAVTAASAVTALRPRWLWLSGLADLVRAISGLLGLEVPLVVDGPERTALPGLAVLSLGLGLPALLVIGAWSRRSLPLVLWSAALSGAFALSRRTNGDEVRYLFGLTAPVLALAGAGLAKAWRKTPWAALLGLSVLVPWGVGHRLVLSAWLDPSHAARVWQVPSIDPVLETLGRAGVGSTYASLQFAARITLESDGRVTASQAWNERVPGDPLRFRDEVDLDPAAAWVLSSRLSRGMPRSTGFRELLTALGGTWKEDLPADFTIFRRFVPPFDEGRPVPREDLSAVSLGGSTLPPTVFDRDVRTAWTAATGLARGSGLLVRVDPPRPLSALVLGLDLERTPLAVPWIAEVDGAVVARGPGPYGLQWVNGVPRAGKQALLAIALDGRPAGEVRVIFQDRGPELNVTEIFAYGPDESPRAPDGAEAAGRALAAARSGRWDEAVSGYAEAVAREPDRAAFHACLARARWRAAGRRWLDVESLDDGGPNLVRPH